MICNSGYTMSHLFITLKSSVRGLINEELKEATVVLTGQNTTTSRLWHAHRHMRFIWAACCFLYDDLSRKWSSARCCQWEEAETRGLLGFIIWGESKVTTPQATSQSADCSAAPLLFKAEGMYFWASSLSERWSVIRTVWANCTIFVFPIKAGLTRVSLQSKQWLISMT